jgi:hypothetical protein
MVLLESPRPSGLHRAGLLGSDRAAGAGDDHGPGAVADLELGQDVAHVRQPEGALGNTASDSSKPRPALVVQDDRFDVTDSVTVCPSTTEVAAPLLRVPVFANDATALAKTAT